MSMNYDDEIARMELEAQLMAQEQALMRVDLELLRMKKKAQDYEVTKVSLNEQIAITKEKLLSLKGGEK